ncbi:MAG: SufBD protein [Peptococcaceae bacterium]|jgi:hypothetical protein|nr:SufBD protein [Peptococcaceae bacterium]
MAVNIAEMYTLLFAKDNNVAYEALQKLQTESENANSVYPYIDKFIDMLDDKNAYIRVRGLTLIAYNAKWDTDYKIDEIIDKYLQHIVDIKPIVARQCIKLLPLLTSSKPDFCLDIISALQKADISIYADSMRPLVAKDIQNSLQKIKA